jgi:lysine-specific histone demethylase 1
MATHLDVQYSVYVSSVDSTGDKVVVGAKSGDHFVADSVICTLPLGVLQRGLVEFSPALPLSKVAAAVQLGCGLVNKVRHFCFPTSFVTYSWLNL